MPQQATLMMLDLGSEPPLVGVPDGISLRALPAGDLAQATNAVGSVALRAYGGRRWRSEADARAAMAGVAGGQTLGPLLDCSVLASRDEAVVGACLVIDKAGDPPRSGPWLLDVFRDPDDPADGIGSAMLAHAARRARSTSLPGITAEVAPGDERARAFLRRLGFVPLG